MFHFYLLVIGLDGFRYRHKILYIYISGLDILRVFFNFLLYCYFLEKQMLALYLLTFKSGSIICVNFIFHLFAFLVEFFAFLMEFFFDQLNISSVFTVLLPSRGLVFVHITLPLRLFPFCIIVFKLCLNALTCLFVPIFGSFR